MVLSRIDQKIHSMKPEASSSAITPKATESTATALRRLRRVTSRYARRKSTASGRCTGRTGWPNFGVTGEGSGPSTNVRDADDIASALQGTNGVAARRSAATHTQKEEAVWRPPLRLTSVVPRRKRLPP